MIYPNLGLPSSKKHKEKLLFFIITKLTKKSFIVIRLYSIKSYVCLNDGTEDIHHLLKHQNLDLHIGQLKRYFVIDAVDMHYHNVQIVSKIYHYQLNDWLALNQNAYQRYKALDNDKVVQIQLLESILIGNILSFSKEDSKGISKIRHWVSLLYKNKAQANFLMDRIETVNPIFYKELNLKEERKKLRTILFELIQLQSFKNQKNETEI